MVVSASTQQNHSKDDELELHTVWPEYAPADKIPLATLLQIIRLINSRFRERLPAWQIIMKHPQHFPDFFTRVLHLAIDEQLPFAHQIEIVAFLSNCFNSLEVDLVCQEAGKLCSMPIWINLIPKQRDFLLGQNSKMKKFWTKIEQKFGNLPAEELNKLDFSRRFLWRLLQRLKRTVDFIDDESQKADIDAVGYCERLVSLFIDLEAQLTTRRFFNALLHSSHAIVHCLLSQFLLAEHGSLFCELVILLKFYARFEIDDVNGQQLTAAEVTKRHYEAISDLQKASFKFLKDKMAEFCLLPIASVDTSRFLREHLGKLRLEELQQIAEYLRLIPSKSKSADDGTEIALTHLDANYGRLEDQTFLREAIVYQSERHPSQLQRLNAEPLYPTEAVLWDEKSVPYEHYDGKNVLPLNKLNLQFLTLHDYLLRNFNLFRMESIYEIRQDIEDVLFRMKPWRHEFNEQEVVWAGWARMALPVGECRVVHVGKPLVGELAPSDVKADVHFSLPSRSDLREEWMNVRRNDVLFLLKLKPIHPVGHKFDVRKPFKSQFEVEYLRGCEVEGILGPDGRVLDEMESRDVIRKMPGDLRVFRVRFDANQYREDSLRGVETDVYFTFNLVVRRDPKTNNFRAVLATIRQLLNTECVVPDWLHDLILGYGEPDTAHYSKMHNTVPSVDFNDTFLSFEHLKNCFPNKQIICDEQNPKPPFRLTFREFLPQHDVEDPAKKDTSIVVESQKSFNRIITEALHKNAIEFTSAQVEAVKAGMQPGLTLVVGPPGTGKTDVAVQIISNIYHNWPEQRTLIVTHSNQALNQLFEKIIRLDVDERHLLRMGHGEEALETEKDFSRYGRVNYVLTERQRLLEQVELLRTAVDETGDVSYSCETAGYFFRYTICKTWEYFVEEVQKVRSQQENSLPDDFVAEHFPFSKFFENRRQQFDLLPLEFERKNFEEDFAIALDGWERIKDIFRKLEEFRAFELLRNGRDRASYLLVKEAKIIAMTCTHAALRRRELVELGFRYDNILMEEAAQILEVETFIPLLLQDPQDGRSRLKRWVMIGDHHQLPPVVQNVAYQKFANMEQSLFARLIRLGVPAVQLDAQGRARAALAALYNWKYEKLGNLPHVLSLSEFQCANPGFLHSFQFIDVPDFNGVGESTPSPYFYQNLGEAEYAVALFVYMRILGYPAHKISIITTYNGQAALLRDVVQRRCAENPFIGVPAKVSTVDKFQGQQNEYIILSLVRTRAIGHLRDVRRLVVALSRARLGLYILGRLTLFQRCYELVPAFERLLQVPTRLILLPNEQFLADFERKPGDAPQIASIQIENTAHLSHFVSEFYKSNLELIKERCLAESGGGEGEEESVGQNEQTVPAAESTVVLPTESVEDAVPSSSSVQQQKEPVEGAIVFEQVDFERLQEVPKY
uniref:Intron-binding protein aquarius n=1 Tax=Globodera rostochiensis TaxID=31243 RepID=A0A914HES8_GLORO